MEKLYKVLKILIILLAAAVILVGAYVLWGGAAKARVSQPTVAVETVAEEAAPDFTFYDAEGNGHKLSDFRGKPVILNFWASWCGPCKAEMPDIEAAYQEYGEQIQFLIVNLTDGSSETVETASGYIAGQGYTFPVFYDTALEGTTAYGVYAIPVTYFLDAQGVVRATNEGMMSAEALEGNIAALLGA